LKADGTVNQGTQQLLPPLVTVTMVALDNASGERWSNLLHNTPVDFLQESGATFTQASDYVRDLEKLKSYLTGLHLNYRVFNTTVVLRNARWDSSSF
jgi:uncharacterized protein (TIGR02599 family)